DSLADLAEFDERRLYLTAGYPSMFAYCVGKLRRSPSAALKRIQSARAALRFPALFGSIAAGRLYLSGVCLIAPPLVESHASELIAAVEGKTNSEIELLLAQRFPRTESLPIACAIASTTPDASEPNVSTPDSPVSDSVHSARNVPLRHSVAPIAAQRVEIRFS